MQTTGQQLVNKEESISDGHVEVKEMQFNDIPKASSRHMKVTVKQNPHQFDINCFNKKNQKKKNRMQRQGRKSIICVMENFLKTKRSVETSYIS